MSALRSKSLLLTAYAEHMLEYIKRECLVSTLRWWSSVLIVTELSLAHLTLLVAASPYVEAMVIQFSQTYVSSADLWFSKTQTFSDELPFKVITPHDPRERGAQLSVLLKDGLMEGVSRALKEHGIVCDQRKPGCIRVAPVPLYNTFADVWTFMQVFRSAIKEQVKALGEHDLGHG